MYRIGYSSKLRKKLRLVGLYKAAVSLTLNTEEECFTETSERSSATRQEKNPKQDDQLINYRHESLKSCICEQIVIIT